MGDLSGLARQLAAALQNPKLRAAVRRSLESGDPRMTALDLQDCQGASLAGQLLHEAERRGAGLAADACAQAIQARGMMLYIDRDRLAQWDSSVVPIVTAIESPGTSLPKTFKGYRSPSVTIDLPGDGSIGGPVLVVLPIPTPSRRDRMPIIRPSVMPVTLPDPPAGQYSRP